MGNDSYALVTSQPYYLRLKPIQSCHYLRLTTYTITSLYICTISFEFCKILLPTVYVHTESYF